MSIQQKVQVGVARRLILTPAMQQSIKLLPMSTIELANMLNQEATKNPLLEEISPDELQVADDSSETGKSVEEIQEISDESLARGDSDYEYFFSEYLDDGVRPHLLKEVKNNFPLENVLSAGSSLAEHLEWQLSSSISDPLLRDIASAIVGNLDDAGYLVASTQEIAAMGQWSESEVSRGLLLVQSFDPIGVAARNLQECLLLQLRNLGCENTPTELIVQEHLRLLESNQLIELSRQLNLSIKETIEHTKLIRRLDPKPGSRYNQTPSQYVVPDVYIKKVDSEYVAVLNEDGIPRLRISSTYKKMLDKSNKDSPETRSYVRENFQSALWLLKSIDQRQKTIYKVAMSILGFQSDFFEHGIDHLRPLILRDVANDIDMHESTVSRVVNNKYMHTPQGVFEMKYFFHGGVHSSRGENISSVVIKRHIQKMIESEDPKKPLSDALIVQALEKQGLILARRTITKYREELRIPTSRQRKVLY
uniref:RNA polymerase sigma-54 factor (SIG54, rpoN) n=1 Tax=uncultured marine thaumarchaeote AD1000_06_A03 TaxID=1455884 RepID=A0A075FLU0_9ARCH|nr:RNA polymerase sigma-54 factor (SIG54, rpoN) [uncultured marine thaumarchaeote AD1000_06_A03]